MMLNVENASFFLHDQGLVKRQTRFTSKCPASEIIAKIEEAVVPLGFDLTKKNYKVQVLSCDNHIILDIFLHHYSNNLIFFSTVTF